MWRASGCQVTNAYKNLGYRPVKGPGDATGGIVGTEHTPVDYRPEGESRHAVPAEVCSTCSNFETGRLVPVAFCPVALTK